MDEGPFWCKACRSVGMVHCAHPDKCGSMQIGKDAWMSWVDDLPLSEDFRPAQDSLQEYIATLTAERDAAFAMGVEAVAERLDLAEHDAEERDWRSGANAFSALAKAARNAAPMTPLQATLALPEVRELVEALNSIARNTCCERCQEAALVARAVLAKLEATK